jgi:hypothetical protein
MRKIFLLMFAIVSIAVGDSITLYNDSVFELIAIVRGADGTLLAQQTFSPGEQSVWSTDQMSTSLDVPYDASSSYTPYTVIWKCSYQGVFSVCYNVASGAIVVATGCAGAGYCNPKPKNNNKNDQTSCNFCEGKLFLNQKIIGD